MFLVWPTKFEKYFEFYAQLICCLKKKKGDCLKSKFLGELGFKSWVCENHFTSYSCIFFIILQCFEERLLKILLIFKNSFFFYNFDRSSLFFDQSKLCLKISVSLCLVRLIEAVFQSIEHCESSFFLTQCLTHSKHFFKLSFLSPTWQGSTQDFLSFSTKFFARFFSPKASKTFIPLLLLLFSWFHA